MPKPKSRPHRDRNRAESRAVEHIEDVREFEDFREYVLPKLRKAMIEVGKGKKTAKDILEMFKAEAAARQVTIAMTSMNEAAALKAVEKILDRTEGPIVQKHDVTHHEKMTDDQLDAQILAKVGKLKSEDDELEH